MSSYQPFYPETFGKILKKYPHLKERVEKEILKILQDPKIQSHLLGKKGKIDLQGKRSRHLMGGKFAIVYMICDECIDSGFHKKGFNNCSFCEGKPEKRVVFLAFDKHENIYSKMWKV